MLVSFIKKDTGTVNIWNKLWWWCIMGWNNFRKRILIFIQLHLSFSWDISSVFTFVKRSWHEFFVKNTDVFKNRNTFSKIISSHCEIYCQHLLKPHSMCNVCDICTAFLFLDMYNTKETIRTDVRLFVSYDS